MKYFVGIVDAGSLSRAARSLHVAQPALTLHMNRLEAELGVQLLLRDVRGATPTEAGKAVYQHAKHVLRQLAATPEVAAQAAIGPSGPVVVGLPWTVSSVIGLDLLRAVLDHLPAVRLQIVEGPSSMLGTLVTQGQLDMAVVFDDTNHDALSLTPMLVEPLWLVGAHGTLKRRRKATLEEACTYPLLLLRRPNGIREILETSWLRLNVKPQVRAEIDSPSLLMQAIASRMGFSILPSASLPGSDAKLRLDSALLQDEALARTGYIAVSRYHHPTAAAVETRHLLTACINDAIAGGVWACRALTATSPA
ncbi:LysR substrate-binding domain-containing protein [Bordetella ansorpii]|uniref:LysR substrate-binding domain-containing protein n=1 Tax=Bordetella ansorpii TaxID=288768 RepID=UPI00082A59BE|nr:LysR substrate-binding domain-containing protein [Bordetella ansorpii]